MGSYSDGETRGMEVEQPKMLTLQEQRLRIEQLEKQTHAEYIAAKEILEHDQKLKLEDDKPNSISFPKPRLESKVEHERCRMHFLIEQHNAMNYALRAKEAELQELEQSMKTVELDSTPDNDEQQYDQRMRQLENTLEKMCIKITEAEKIHTTYLLVRDHLSMEVHEMPMLLDRLQNSVFQGQTELWKVAEMSQTAVAAVDITKSQLVHMERQLIVERRKMEGELIERRAEKDKEVQGRLEREKEGDRRSGKGAVKVKDHGRKSAREGLSDDFAPVRAQHQPMIPSTPQALVKLVEEVDALTESLSCTDLNELEQRLVSQKATMEQLNTQVTQTEALVKQRTDTLAALELQYARLKFNVVPGSEKFDQLKEEMETERRQEVERLANIMEKLSKAQAALTWVELGINNLYYSTICVPLPKDTHSKNDGLDVIDKLKDIIIRLSILQAKPPLAEDASPDPEKVWTFLENSILHEPRNIKRICSPEFDNASEDMFQFRGQEEDSSLSREEIKRRSLQLIEACQPKKIAPKAPKKT